MAMVGGCMAMVECAQSRSVADGLDKAWRTALAAAALTLALAAQAAAQAYLPHVSEKLTITGGVRTRTEVWNFFDAAEFTDDYNFTAVQTRAALRWQDDAFDVVAEAQNTNLLGLPTNAVAPAPQGPLGLGGVYYIHNRRRSDGSLFLKQGYLNLKRTGVEGLSLQLGRFEFNEGNDLASGEPTLDWLKNVRLSQRLIGSFGWSHVGRAFDGVTARYTKRPFHFTGMLSRPTQGGFDLDGMRGIDDIDLAYGGASLVRPPFLENADFRLFYIYYQDRRGQVKVDNRPLPERQGDDRGRSITVHTEGAHFAWVVPTAAGPFDLLLWGAIQQGDWGTLSHRAWVWDAEIGWQPAEIPLRPWLRAGVVRSSGDDDPEDGRHGTFFQILPTVRLYALSTFYNMMNTTNPFCELLLRPLPGLVSRTGYHYLTLTESRDLWYQAAGATLADRNRPEGFGFPGRPSGGERDLMHVAETSLSYNLSARINLNFYYAHSFGGRVVANIFDSGHADFGYVELQLNL